MQENTCCRKTFGGAKHECKTEGAVENIKDLVIHTEFFCDFGKHKWFVLLLW